MKFYKSYFKKPDQNIYWMENWVKSIEDNNGRNYSKRSIATSIGKTQVYILNADSKHTESLVIFPGARTSVLFWDLDKGLDHLKIDAKIYLVETNGLPNLSDGLTPDIYKMGFGKWATEVLDGLNLDRCFVAGASFGGLICMKLALTNPERLKAIFLLNPGCLQPFSMSCKNLFYNLLPIVFPSQRNIRIFLDNAVFCKPNHQLSAFGAQHLIDYEEFALKNYKDNTQKPYYMDTELEEVEVPTHLLVGAKDLLFPYRKSVSNALARIPALGDVKIFENVGHGIETHSEAISYIGQKIREYIRVKNQIPQ